MTSSLNWENIGTIQPAANWLNSTATTANLFKFVYSNTPDLGLLEVAQTDGFIWFFEQRTLASRRNNQLLFLELNPVFANGRCLSLKSTNPSFINSGWTVTIFAATVPTLTVESVAAQFAALSVQNQAIIQTQQVMTASIAAGFARLETLINGLATAPSTSPPSTSPPSTAPGVPSAAGVAYTASQSSNYGGINATYATLTDGDGTTGTTTWEGAGWIKAAFPYPVTVASVQVGGGNIHNVGFAANSLNGTALQYSTDNATWTTVWTVTGVTDAGASQFVTYQLPSPIVAQYWRLTKAGSDTATSEFKFS